MYTYLGRAAFDPPIPPANICFTVSCISDKHSCPCSIFVASSASRACIATTRTKTQRMRNKAYEHCGAIFPCGTIVYTHGFAEFTRGRTMLRNESRHVMHPFLVKKRRTLLSGCITPKQHVRIYLGLVDRRPVQMLELPYFIHGQFGEELQEAYDVTISRISPKLRAYGEGHDRTHFMVRITSNESSRHQVATTIHHDHCFSYGFATRLHSTCKENTKVEMKTRTLYSKIVSATRTCQ